jgi:putative restriction endonuclease
MREQCRVAVEHRRALDDAASAIEGLRRWKRRGVAAPHKPLLILIGLRRVTQGLPRWVAFPEIERELGELIARYSGVKSAPSPQNPFWRLQSDGLWEIKDAGTFDLGAGGSVPTVKDLRTRPAYGGFPARLDAALRAEPAEMTRLARLVAAKFFEPSDEVLGAVGVG